MTASPPSTPATVVIAANSVWNIVNFSSAIVAALKAEGWRVVAVAPDDGDTAALAAMGVELVPVRIDSSGTSVLRDGRLFLDYLHVLRRLRPAALLGFTVKPNVYGSLVARLLGIRTINNISGLGTAFLKPGLLNWLVSRLYRLSLAKSAKVFFLNPADLALFVGNGLVRSRQAALIPGTGIDLQRFKPAPMRRSGKHPFRFLFVGRLLRDKGLVEYVDAARSLRASWPDVEFAILGFAASDNRSAVPIAQVERWQEEGVVRYLGESPDVRPFLEESDCIVLPSYREGLPRSLLEAAAMARPMVATDVPGCRDVVVDGDNGLLCRPRSAASLADTMDRMLRLTPAERSAMGRRARHRVEREFDEALVVGAYLEALR